MFRQLVQQKKAQDKVSMLLLRVVREELWPEALMVGFYKRLHMEM